MNIEEIRALCLSLPYVVEDVKWSNDLCFTIGGKMFCVTNLTGKPSVSFKVTDEEFDELIAVGPFIPAPYVARYKWVLLEEPGKISKKKLEQYIARSYNHIRTKLPKKTLKELGIS